MALSILKKGLFKGVNAQGFNRRLILFGASGQIGSALHRRLTALYASVQVVPWAESLTFALQGGLEPGIAYDVIFACGLTNPKDEQEALQCSNVEFPLGMIEKMGSKSLVRFVTLGTIMEMFPEACVGNAYLESKLELSKEMTRLSLQYPDQLRHIRLHTVYGGVRRHLKPHMFLGQIVAALESTTDFFMSSGDQLREYHSVDAIADSMANLLTAEWTGDSVVHWSHGQPCRLADLATAIFEAFDQKQLLHIGTIARAQAENTGQIFPTTVEINPDQSPIQGVVQWLKRVIE